MRSPVSRSDTAERILDIAEKLVQTRGYNGFSYADIASELAVTKASLHYHFAAKAELGRRLIERYADNFAGALRAIDGDASGTTDKLEQYVAIYADVLRAGRMCLCGMLAADQATLPPPIRAGLRRFFDLNETWLEAALAQGRAAGALRFAEPPLERARLLVATLEGAMLLARAFDDAARFETAAQRALADLAASTGEQALA